MKFTHQAYHHTADKQRSDQFEKIKADHIDRGWGNIGYNFLFERDGRIIEGRPLDIRGAHTVNVSGERDLSGLPYNTFNAVAIGYCLAGDFTQEEPTQAQIHALHDLSYMHQLQFQIPDVNRFNHYEVSKTLCPSMDLRMLIDEYHVEYLRKRLARAQKALRWAKLLRRAMLLRLIARIKKVLFSNLSLLWI